MQRLRYEELAPNFIAYSIRSKLAEAAQSNKARIHNEVAEVFLTKLGDRSSIPYKSGVNTKANLSSTVLYNIVSMLGLDYSYYVTKEKLLDERLLASRNNIAHGRSISVDVNDFIELHDQILGMMEDFRNQIDNSAALRKYRRT